MSSHSLQQLAQQLQTQSLTLVHALDQEWDMQLLMEISYQISGLSSQFRDQILEETVAQLQGERLKGRDRGDPAAD